MKTANQGMIRWRLRVLMAERHMSNKELAEASGISDATISRLKNKDEIGQISGDVLSALCRALDCKLSDLMDYSPD